MLQKGPQKRSGNFWDRKKPEICAIIITLPSIKTSIGELAQLVERFHGMEEAIGSNPLFSTKKCPILGIFVFWGISSACGALPPQGRGHRFEPDILHPNRECLFLSLCDVLHLKIPDFYFM